MVVARSQVSSDPVNRLRDYVPFTAETDPCDGEGAWYVTRDGECIRYFDASDDLRITAPYIEPKPPTIAERLEALRDACLIHDSNVRRLDSIIADVKALEASSK